MPVDWQVCSATRASRASNRMPALKSVSLSQIPQNRRAGER